ncbi:MAG: non-heme iron oxygenase ferredoxin subunit [Chloroflexota bacterium]|nr:non-heme iron oxygenase ferredoxin subunit [Chloroflexota bacterium]
MTDIVYTSVCSTADLPAGERLFLEVGDLSIVLLNQGGEYFAIADRCTHDDGPLGEGEMEDHQIICPRHGARFDIRTGEVLALPAIQDIPTYSVHVVDGMIEIGIEA